MHGFAMHTGGGTPQSAQPHPSPHDQKPSGTPPNRSKWTRTLGIAVGVVATFVVVAFISYTLGKVAGSPMVISAPSVQFDGPAAADFARVSACGTATILPGSTSWSCVVTVQNVETLPHSITSVTIGGSAVDVLIDKSACVEYSSCVFPTLVSGGASVNLYLTSYVLNAGPGSYSLTVEVACSP
jgi:hypothetical protein